MPIPEVQLETWSHQGAVTTAKATADSIRNALNSYTRWPAGIQFEVYLQGSYKNDTNIRGDSDVDVVAQLNSTFYNNLREDQKQTLGLTSAPYGWSHFRTDVLLALRGYYGQGAVSEGNKAINVRAPAGRLPADVIVCAQYKRYRTVSSYDYVEGMCLWSRRDNRQIINYPRAHYNNGVSKHQATGQRYKPAVRLFKNARSYITGDSTPSYFLECMVFNVPDPQFATSYQLRFCNIVNWLNTCDVTQFICQNGQTGLFGPTPEQWDSSQARSLIGKLIALWNNW